MGIYNIYNSKFPTSWFTHITDPFSAENPKHKQWGAKIRPANIIRPNVDFLRGEYSKRSFDYSVAVRGSDGYNNFLETRKKAVYQNLSQHFINAVNEEFEQTEGADTGVDTKPVQMPEELIAELEGKYKDILAEQGQTDLDLIMADQHIHEKLRDMMKDWLVAGEVFSWKDVVRDKVLYDRVSPLELDYDKSPHVKYIQDGAWACRRIYMTVPDVVDRFYDSLTEKNIDYLENGPAMSSPSALYNYLQNSEQSNYNKIPVYHYVWKSMQKIGFLKGMDPLTGTPYSDIVNDTYVVNKEMGEEIEWEWVTQVLEGYRIAEDIYTEMGPVAFQANMISDFSKHKLTYNGKRFSDTHADNISVAKLGLPFQIMYCITFFTLERTMAKSRGKIVLLDKNVIPYTHGWDEEKFFYYSEAQGYMLIDRNQQGVDKSFNQYQVLDLSLFDHIKNLIEILQFCRSEYDEQLGISRQSKAQMAPSDSGTQAQQAVYQTSIMTEMIFADFDDFVRTEVEGLLDCSQIANRNGKQAAYQSDDMRTALLDINPEYYCYSELGIMVTNSAKEKEALNRIRQYTQAMAQNNLSPSALVEIEAANNVAKLKGILKNIETKQMEIAKQQQDSEHQQEIEQIQVQQQFKEYENLLDIEKMNQEYTRKEELIILQGDINLAIQNGTADADGDGNIDITDVMARQTERDKIYMDKAKHDKSEGNKMSIEDKRMKLEEKKLQVKQKEIDSKERTAKASKAMDLKIARAKPKPKATKAK